MLVVESDDYKAEKRGVYLEFHMAAEMAANSVVVLAER